MMTPWRLCPSTSEGEQPWSHGDSALPLLRGRSHHQPGEDNPPSSLGVSLPRCPALFIAISCDSVVKGSSSLHRDPGVEGSSSVHRVLSARRVRSGSKSFSPHLIKTQYTNFEPTQSKASQAHAVHTDYNPIIECQCNPGTIVKSSSLFLTHFLVYGRLIDKFGEFARSS